MIEWENMNTDFPIISVLMGTYYRRTDITALQQSVRSILGQSYRNFEFLICDDGSSQEAVRFLDHIAAKDSRVVLVRPGNALSLPVKLNCCLKAAKGDYIARMDDDDRSYAERFVQQMTFLWKHPEIAFVGSNVQLVQHGEIVGQRLLPEFPTVRDFYMTQPYIHPALLFRKAPLLEIGGYSEAPSAILCEDYDLLLRLYAQNQRGANLQAFLLDYTIPDTAKGSRKMRHRWNEVVTRYHRFRELHVLWIAWPYVGKPIAVGLLPEGIVKRLKERRR